MGLLEPHGGRRRSGRPSQLKRAIVVHDLAQARVAATAARALGCDLPLAAPEHAAAALGPLWWKTLCEQLAAEFPDVVIENELDCGPFAGTAAMALRLGLKRLRFSGEAGAARRLARMAKTVGARLETARPPRRLDLSGEADAPSACTRFLGGTRLPGER